jgi:flagellar hook-length control protein FliK
LKNVNEILNSLFQPASETKLFPKEKAAVPAKGFEGEVSSFEDVLAQLASEDADVLGEDSTKSLVQASAVPVQGEDGSTPTVSTQGNFFESITSIAEIDIRITESVRLTNVDAKLLEKVEQSLMSLAVGLSKLLQLISNLQFVDPSKAQDLLVSASGGRISPKDAKALTDLLSLTSKEMSLDQNPLLMTFAQQNGLLNQMFQQMINDQQILLGQSVASSASANGNNILMSDFSLQMTFAETDIRMIRTADARGSQVFINLQTFQMAASFTQVGTGGISQSNADFHQSSSFQQIFSENSAVLSTKLDQMFSAAGFSGFSTVQPHQEVSRDASFSGMDRNFKNLVQLLMQTGVSQAVLTTFLNQQRDFSHSELQQALAQNLSLDHLLQTLIPPAKILPIESANSTSDTTHKAGNFNSAPSGQIFAEEMIIQESASIGIRTVAVNNSVQAINSQVVVGASVLQESILIETQNSPLPLAALNPQFAPGLDTQALGFINDTVMRLNGLVSQGLETSSRFDLGTQSLPKISPVDQFLTSLGVDLSAPPSSSKPGVYNNNVLDVVNVSSTQLLQVALSAEKFSFSQAGSALGSTVITKGEAISISTSTLSLTSLKDVPTQNLVPSLFKIEEKIGANGIGVDIEMNDPLGLSIRSKATVGLSESLLPAVTTSVSVPGNISASIVTGEVAKSILPTLLPIKNTDLNQPTTIDILPKTLEVKPITPQAVTSAASGVATNPLLDVLKEQTNNENKFSASAQIAGPIVANVVSENLVTTHKSSAQSNVVTQAQTNAIDGAHVLNQISDHLSQNASEVRAVSRLSFQLMPESLGRVTVQIALVDQTVSARIVVSNPDVKDTLQHHMVDLKTALNQAGLQIDQLQVQVQGGSSNLLAQYFQYQQEGFGYRLPASLVSNPVEEPKTLENKGVLGEMSIRTSLLDVLV